MNVKTSSRNRQWAEDPRRLKMSRRRQAGGRGYRRLIFDHLEFRQLLALTTPVAEFPIRTSGGIPVGSVVDPSGNDWVLLSTGNIAEIGTSGITQYQVPSYNALAGAPTGSELGLITYDAVDGNIWFYEANSNEFGMLAPSTGAIAEFPALFFSSDPDIYQITAGSDGNIWFTEPNLNEIGMFDIKTDLISQFTMPLPDTQPQGITSGSDGNLWFTEGGLNQLGSLNPVTHVLSSYAYEPPGYSTNDQAEGITSGPNNTIWFVETQNDQVEEFNITTQTFTDFIPEPPIPAPNPVPSAQLWSIGEGPDGNIYYTEPAFNTVAELNPTTGLQTLVQAVNLTGQPTQVTPNLTHALIAPEDTTGTSVFVTVPSNSLLIAINTTNLGDGLPDATLPALAVADDANDVINVNGELYYTDTTDGNGAIEEFNPATQLNTLYQLPEFPVPVPPAKPPNPLPAQDPDQMTVDSNGNIWFTETAVNAIGEFDPSTGTFITQTALTAVSSNPTAIAWDSIEQEFWMTEPGLNQIINFNPATSGSAAAPITIPDPVGVLVDPTSGYLWIAEGSADKIIEYSPINEHILYSYSTTGSPSNLIWGPDGNIWFTESARPDRRPGGGPDPRDGRC